MFESTLFRSKVVPKKTTYKIKRAVYDAKRAAELQTFGNVLKREDDRAKVFKIAQQMTATNRSIIGNKCVRKDRGDLVTSDHGNHLAWKEHYQRLLSQEFEWNKQKLSASNPFIGPYPPIDKESVRKALQKMKKGKAS